MYMYSFTHHIPTHLDIYIYIYLRSINIYAIIHICIYIYIQLCIYSCIHETWGIPNISGEEFQYRLAVKIWSFKSGKFSTYLWVQKNPRTCRQGTFFSCFLQQPTLAAAQKKASFFNRLYYSTTYRGWYGWWKKSCVHQLRLVVEIYHYLQGFSTIQTVVLWDFWTINSR